MVSQYNQHASKIRPKVFVIVLNYNGKDTLKKCLRSLFSSDYLNLEVVVVDNDSQDGSIEMVKAQFSRVHYIISKKNVGFSAGNNQGIRFALEKHAKYVLLLNNDAFVNSDTITRLVRVAQDRRNESILSPVIYCADDKQKKPWFCGGKIDWKHMRTQHVSCAHVPEHPFETEYVTGCAMFIPQEIFAKIGLLDERYFLYYEDADFSVRALKAGFSLRIVPGALVGHYEVSKQNTNKLYWLVVSGIIFFTSPKTAKNLMWTNLYLMVRKCKNTIDILRKKDLEKAQIMHRAFRDAQKAKTLHNYSEL